MHTIMCLFFVITILLRKVLVRGYFPRGTALQCGYESPSLGVCLLLLLRQMLMAVQWCHWSTDGAGLTRQGRGRGMGGCSRVLSND